MARWGIALALVLTALAAAPARAATWQPAGVPFGGQTEDARLAMAPDGTLYALGIVGGQGLVSARPPLGAFAAPFASPAAGVNPPALDFAATGDAVGAGGASGVAKAAFHAAGAASGFGAAQTLVSATAFPGVSVNEGGAALAAWAPYPGPSAVAYADRPAGSGSAFGAPAAPAGSPAADGGFGLPIVIPILDDDGSATILSSTYAAGQYTIHQVSRASGAAAFGSSSVVATGIAAPAFAVNARGDAVLAWESGGAILAAFRPHDGVFGAPEVAATPNALGFSFSTAQLGLDASGRALLAWSDLVSGCATTKPRIALAVRSTGGTWAPGGSLDGRNPVLGLAENSDRFALLYRVAGGAEGDHCAIQADRAVAVTGTAGEFDGAPQDLPGQTTSALPTASDVPKAAAMDAAGNAYVLWTDGAGGPRRAAALEAGAPPPGGAGGGGDGGDGGGGADGSGGASAGGGAGSAGAADAAGAGSPAPTAPTLDPFGQFLASAPGFVRTSAPTSARLVVSCRQGTCTIVVDGQLLVYGTTRTGRAAPAAKPKPAAYRLGRVAFTLTAGARRTVALKLPNPARAAARRALARGAKVQAIFTVRNNGARRTATTTFRGR